MAYYFVLFVSSFLIALILRLRRFIFHQLAENTMALVNELIADIDENLKIERIQKSSNALLLSLFKMFLLIIIAIIVAAIPIIGYCFFTEIEINKLDFTTFYAIIDISAGATLAFIIPFKKKVKSNYSELSQLLHRMALNNYHVARKLFKKELKNIRKKEFQRRSDFVIISGLARAGTTSLMNDLAKIDAFVSLSYANMPFLLCPNIWAKFYKPKNNKLQERSHKDGIMIGFNSNEALEEYFFKVQSNDAYITDDALLEYKISKEVYSQYIDYQNVIKKNDNKIYMAKNNNFIIRYKSVRELNDDFVMVFLFREPLMHAASLLEKHKEYEKMQKEDPFVLEYMNWLGHHEFGLNQKQFLFAGQKKIIKDEKHTLDYWLKIWINYYNRVLEFNHRKTLFVNYDDYCAKPTAVIERILQHLNINFELPAYHTFKNRREVNEKFSPDLYASATEIYNKLKMLH